MTRVVVLGGLPCVWSFSPLVLKRCLLVCFFKVDSMRFCIIGAWDRDIGSSFSCVL